MILEFPKWDHSLSFKCFTQVENEEWGKERGWVIFSLCFVHIIKISLHLLAKECGGEWSFHIHAIKAHTIQQEYAG